MKKKTATWLFFRPILQIISIIVLYDFISNFGEIKKDIIKGFKDGYQQAKIKD